MHFFAVKIKKKSWMFPVSKAKIWLHVWPFLMKIANDLKYRKSYLQQKATNCLCLRLYMRKCEWTIKTKYTKF